MKAGEHGHWIARRLTGQAVALASKGERVMTADIDFMAFFDATPSPYLVLYADLVIRYVNPACLRTADRTKDELIGKYFFDVLPENPGIRHDAERNPKASPHRLLDTRRPGRRSARRRGPRAVRSSSPTRSVSVPTRSPVAPGARRVRRPWCGGAGTGSR